jgi:hypothetical protein
VSEWTDPWADVRAARLPADGLGALAAVRCRPGVTVHATDGYAWVVWPTGDDDLVRCLRPVRGVEFFANRDGRWYRFGRRLPTDEWPPVAGGTPLDRTIVPAVVTPLGPPATTDPPVRLRIVRGGPPHEATACRCPVRELARWADTATSLEIESVRAARYGDRALLLGSRLPAVRGGERFWGERVLIPVGYRPEPDLPEHLVREACRVSHDELVLLDAEGAEAIPARAFAPLTRAGLRLALAGALDGPRT